MKKTLLPLATALLLTVAPAYAQVNSETHVEERVEKNGDLGTRRTERTVDTEREAIDGSSSKSVERNETVENDGRQVKKKVQERTETKTDQDD